MDILIRNMEMPQNCRECALETDYGTCGYYSLYVEAMHESEIYKRRDDCPLAEVPPNESLIYKDKLNWLRSRCRAGVEQYFDREQWDHLEIIDIRNSIAKRKAGKWIYVFNYMFKCSECGFYNDVRSKYCPDCGARMVNHEYTD